MRKLLKSLRFVIVAGIGFNGVVSPLMAETWECVVPFTKNADYLPTQLTFELSDDRTSVLVADNVSKSFGRSAIKGSFLTDNAKRQRITWRIDGLQGQRLSSYYNTSYNRLDFTATRFKETGKMFITSKPHIHTSVDLTVRSQKGKCALR
jgi:hypothetical protein